MAEAFSSLSLQMGLQEGRVEYTPGDGGLVGNPVGVGAGFGAGGVEAGWAFGGGRFDGEAQPPGLKSTPALLTPAGLQSGGVPDAVGVPMSNATHKSGVQQGNLPESLLDIVLAGLGPADENLCAFCCTTLVPGLSACSACGTPAPPGRAPPSGGVAGGEDQADSFPRVAASSSAAAAEGGGVVDHRLSLVKAEPSQGSSVQGGGVSALPPGLVVGNVRSEVRPPPGIGSAAVPAPSLPAGVLAVNNLAEVGRYGCVYCIIHI